MPSLPEKTKVKNIFDSVWGSCSMNCLSQMFIDTYEFQRMRNMKQLGASYYVFSSASGNRFEHSIGVGHLAKLMSERLQKKHPDLVSDRQVELIQIAGLCHDLGHGPFSHVFDVSVKDHDTPNRYHENRSVNIVHFMIKKYKIPINKEEAQFICDTFNPSKEQKKKWEYQIISNDTIDVDRMDYIIRDTQNIGIQVNFTKHQAWKLISSATIKENQIIFGSECDDDITDFLTSRKYLYERIYNHHASSAISNMIIQVFKKVEFLYHLKRSVDDVERFLKFDDSLLNIIYFDQRVPQDTKDIITKIYQREFKEYYN